MRLTDNAIFVLKNRYCRHGESPYSVYPRVAKTIGEPVGLEKEFLRMMQEKRWMPASPILANAGPKLLNFYQPCVVLPIGDSIEEIFDTLNRTAVITKYGGGVGINFSRLREEGSPLTTGGTSSGSLSFMRIFNSVINEVKQGGMRRGAMIGTLSYDHPEILDFISLKMKTSEFTNFNLSVLVDDQFMKSIESNDTIPLISRYNGNIIQNINAKELFYLISFASFYTGDPGLQFFDTINRDNPLYPTRIIDSSNPCSEEFMFPHESCSLVGVNLNEHITSDGDVDYDKYRESIEYATKFLLAVNELGWLPYKEMYDIRDELKRIGVGVTGVADALIKMGIRYDDKEHIKLIKKLGPILREETRKYAPDSISRMAIAPEGSRSILLGCSASIEPVYKKKYTRTLSFGEIIESRPDSEYLIEAHEVDPMWRLKINSEWQNYIDNGISSTINLPFDTSYTQIYKIYYHAWLYGLKGITVFRDGSRGEQVYRECRSGKCDL